jgi:hypothetical protein
MPLLRPLLLDKVPSVQHATALALGRLANTSKEIAEEIITVNLIPQLINSLEEKNVRLIVRISVFIRKQQCLY